MNPFVEACHAGLSPFPVRKGTKTPAISWKQFQSEICSEMQAIEWGNGDNYSIGIVTGEVSGRLMAVDIEAAFMPRIAELGQRMAAAGVGAVFDSWVTGYSEETPRGGLHVLVRLEGEGPCPRNEVFARDDDRKVLIETRGEGGYILVAPSPGYMVTGGAFDKIVYCTLEEWALIEAVLASFDATPAPPALTVPTRSTVRFEGILAEGPRWIDEVKAGLPSMGQILEDRGFVFVRDDGLGPLFRHPASTNEVSVRINANGRLYVFSTSLPLPASSEHGDHTYDVVDVLFAYEVGHVPSVDERVAWLEAQRSPAERNAGATPGGGPKAAIPNLSPEPCIEDWFWEATPLLRQLRDSAMERGLSPDGVFGAWFSDYATTIPMGIWVAGPPRRAPLNMYCVLVGSSGTGKTGSMGVADELLGWNHNTNPHVLLGRSLRSGEGLPKLATIPRKKGDLDDGSPSYHNAVQICFDEGGVLGKQADRQGSTSIPYLNTAWSGSGMVGGALAREIFEFPANLVRICCVMGVQYGAAANLFTGEAALLGFPQRLLYFGLSHPALADTDVTQQASDPANPLGHPFYTHSDYTGKPIYLHLPDHIEHQIRLWTQNKDHGDGIDDPLDAHQMNLTKRAASILALAHQASTPDEQHWLLADHVYQTSRKIRRRLIASLGEATMERRRARINEAVDTADALDNRWILRRATRLARYIHNSQEPVITKDLRRRLAGDEKPRIKEILDYAQDRGWVIHKDARWQPGGSQPA